MPAPRLIPEPKNLKLKPGTFTLPNRCAIGITDWTLKNAAEQAAAFLPSPHTHITVPGLDHTLELTADSELDQNRYRLTIGPSGIRICGATPVEVGHGVQTLRQIIAQSDDGTVPCLAIEDWPDFADRGVYYDVCRGRVPTLDRLCQLADNLAKYKINQLQLYIEHTLAFRNHPKIGRGASPLTADDILELDAYCAERAIELVPSLACFGHLSTVLRIPEYRHLAEDWGVGKYKAPKEELPKHFARKGWTLSPANPDAYDFLDSLFAEFLPLFRSRRFNICCDETWDLGFGQSYEMCKKKGKGRVYLDHILKVRKIAARYGKTIMFWGDIIRHSPELIAEIPDDVTVLDWGYNHSHPFDRIKDFKQAGVPFYACPGTNGWVSLFPRLPEAVANIANFAAAGHKHGACGLLNTDWGDGGHYNFMEYSWHGYLFGAEQAWNTGADTKTFTQRFTQLFLNTADPELADAIDQLGDISQTGGPCYQSVWQTIFFATPEDPIFHYEEPVDMNLAKNGRITIEKRQLDAHFGENQLAQLKEIRRIVAKAGKQTKTDPLGVLPYWIFAVDTIACAARKLSTLGPGGKDTAVARSSLKREMTQLMKRFETLWMARNRRSEIRITLRRYRKAIDALRN